MTPADRRLLRARLDVALWPIPAVLTVLAAVLAELVSRIPTDTAQTLLVLPDFGPSTALAVLSAIATGMLTFTGLVAAVILLALQFGASQLSPRLLRTLVGRSPAKWALGVSIAAFVYSLLVIGEVSPQGSSASVPALAVEVAIVLVIAAIGASLYLLHATTQALRVARVATEVAHKGMTVIEGAYPHAAGDAPAPPPALPDGAPAVVAWHGHPGVIAGIELRPLVALATRENLVVELIPAVGDRATPRRPGRRRAAPAAMPARPRRHGGRLPGSPACPCRLFRWRPGRRAAPSGRVQQVRDAPLAAITRTIATSTATRARWHSTPGRTSPITSSE